MMQVLGLWLSALFTLAIYSFLYKDNPVYKFAEHLYVGVSTGYLVVVALRDALFRDVWQPLFINPIREPIVIIPAILGTLMFFHLVKNLSWLARLPIAIVVGIGAGVAIPNNVQSYLLKQTNATIIPLMNPGMFSAGTWHTDVTNLLILIGVLCVLFYFFFSVKHEGILKPVSRLGIFYLMLFFGAAFGYTVMGRVSLLIGRMRFLLLKWLGL